MKELASIQKELKAPKNLFNSFGKYKYRNFEGICEAVKPLLAKYGCTLVVTDSIEAVGDRIYVKATATIKNGNGESETVSAYAREAEEKKGMDDSQITGTASSYARKYCLNGLFLLDDTKDADSDEYKTEAENRSSKTKTEVEYVDEKTLTTLVAVLEGKQISPDYVWNLYKVKSPEKLTKVKYADIIKNIDKIKAKFDTEVA